jgi:hypothetical protein
MPADARASRLGPRFWQHVGDLSLTRWASAEPDLDRRGRPAPLDDHVAGVPGLAVENDAGERVGALNRLAVEGYDAISNGQTSLGSRPPRGPLP